MNLVDREKALALVAICTEVGLEDAPDDSHIITTLSMTIIHALQDETMLPTIDPIKANVETQEIINNLNIGKE